MSKSFIYLIIVATVILAGVAGYLWWKNSSATDDTPSKVIKSLDIYRRDDNFKVGSVWIANGDVLYDLDESASDMISYIVDNKIDWLENGLSYDIGGCDNGLCWDGEKKTTVGEDDFINGVYTTLFDEFLVEYIVDAVEE